MLKIELDEFVAGTPSRQTYDRIYASESAIGLRDGFYRWIFRTLRKDGVLPPVERGD